LTSRAEEWRSNLEDIIPSLLHQDAEYSTPEA
jgi:hypothetical protein